MELNKKIKQQTITSIVYKVVGMIISFLFVPILLEFLGKEDYGIWITISSILLWFSFLDFGMGLGLRNKLTRSLAVNNIKESQSYISSAYFVIFIIFILLMFILIIISTFVDWGLVLNIGKYNNSELLYIIQIAVVGFCLRFIFKLVDNLNFAIHQPSLNELIQTFTQVTILFAILFTTKELIEYNNLINITIIYSILPIGVLLMATIYFFSKRRDLIPKINSINIKKGLEVSKLGSQFLLLQLSAIILSTILPFMVTKYIGSSKTTEYHIAFKYFNLIQVAMLLILNPYWSAVTHKYQQNDFEWIWTSFKKTMLWSLLALVLVVVSSIFSPYIFELWVGKDIVSTIYIFWSALFVAGFVITQPIITFINGIGEIKEQMYFSIAIIILVIPLDLVLFNYTTLGLGSFLLPPIIFRVIRSIFGFRQLKKILIK